MALFIHNYIKHKPGKILDTDAFNSIHVVEASKYTFAKCILILNSGCIIIKMFKPKEFIMLRIFLLKLYDCVYC